MDLRISDSLLLADCRVETFRGPGPGGQKRNKTSSAVRITHLPTGIAASAAESRSQHQNRRVALRRLRLRLAMRVRSPVDLQQFRPPGWLSEAMGQRGLPGLTPRAEIYPAAACLVLDLLSAAGGSISLTAKFLRVSTGSLSAFLSRDRHLLAAANDCRRTHNLRPLGSQT